MSQFPQKKGESLNNMKKENAMFQFVDAHFVTFLLYFA